MTVTPVVLRTPHDFSPRRVRLLGKFVERAVRRGILHPRPEGWLESVIAAGQIRALLIQDRVVGLFLIRPARDDKLGPVVYASTCLWRTAWPGAITITNEVMVRESRLLLGSEIFGAFFKGNQEALEFYTPANGWRVIDRASFPTVLWDEVDAWREQVILVSRPLAV